MADAAIDVAGIGGTQMPEQPTAWSFYIATEDPQGAFFGILQMPPR